VLLRVDDIRFGYGPKGGAPLVLDGVSMFVRRGGLVGVLGPNGAGKSTLLRLMSGTRQPSNGRVWLEDRPLDAIPRRELARRIAVVPQETHLAFDYTVLEMVLMGRHPHLGVFEVEGPADLAAAREALGATGTAHLADRDFATLSGGEKQRVIIAAALAQASDMMLLDEPTASLDLGYQLELAGLLHRLNQERGMTMVVSTHDLNLAASLCRELVLLKGGRVIAAGPIAEVLTPDSISALYDVDADVRMHTGAGHLTVVPIRRVAR
jgi:iron complex transport system ATP-binding protein